MIDFYIALALLVVWGWVISGTIRKTIEILKRAKNGDEELN